LNVENLKNSIKVPIIEPATNSIKLWSLSLVESKAHQEIDGNVNNANEFIPYMPKFSKSET
jgi:hypothetical protein